MTPDEFTQWIEKRKPHYRHVPEAKGKKIGFSELAMWCKHAGKKILDVYVGEHGYAYGLVEDGDMIDGSFSMTGNEWVSFA